MHPARHIITVALLLSCVGCTKFQVLNALIPPCGYHRTTDIPYGDQPRQRLDVYQPTHAKPNAPVVLFFYGGTWQYGKKADYRFVAQSLASKGFLTILPDYRLHPAVNFPAFVEDGARAVRWAHENAPRFGGDPQRLFLMGHSAGAHITTLLALDEHYLKDAGVDSSVIHGAIGLSGPYDFTPGGGSRAVFGMTSAASPVDPNIEPIHFARKGAPPILLIHGQQDAIVAADNAVHLADRLNEVGAHAQLILYPKLGHVTVCLALAGPFRWIAPILNDVAAFISSH